MTAKPHATIVYVQTRTERLVSKADVEADDPIQLIRVILLEQRKLWEIGASILYTDVCSYGKTRRHYADGRKKLSRCTG
jgi:hypothetical protein